MSGAKGVQIQSLEVPDSLKPGDRATARIEANNTSNFIAPWDADRCNEGNNYGIRVEAVVVGPDGEEHVGETVCAPQHDVVVTHPVTATVSFEAPERDGTHRFEAFVRTAETGEESGRVSESIDVFREEDDAPEKPPEDPDDGDRPDWLPDPTGDGPPIQAILGVVLLLGGFYAAGNLFDIGIGYGGGGS